VAHADVNKAYNDYFAKYPPIVKGTADEKV